MRKYEIGNMKYESRDYKRVILKPADLRYLSRLQNLRPLAALSLLCLISEYTSPALKLRSCQNDMKET